MRHRPSWIVAVALAACSTATGATPPHWVGAWQASPTIAITFDVPYIKMPPPVHGTIRYAMRLTAGGDALRIRLSGETRDTPFRIARARLGTAARDGTIRSGSARALTFGGSAAALVPGRAPLVSDPVALAVKAGDDVVIELILPEPVKLDQADRQLSVGVTDESGSRTIVGARPLVSAIDVETGAPTPVVVAFGDSITDGTGGSDPMRGWPGALAERAGPTPLSVVNAGIGGNRLLEATIGPSALARFDRDVGAVSGVTHLIVLEGINDIGSGGMSYPGQSPMPSVTADAIIAGYRQLIERAHLRGLRIVGATLTPFAGVPFPGYYSPAKDLVRQAVNGWIRTAGAFDGVADFDRAVRDPARPDRLDPRYDSGDHLHPSDAGYRAMAAAVDLRLFDRRSPVPLRAPRRRHPGA